MLQKEATREDVVDLVNWLTEKVAKDPNAHYCPGLPTSCMVCQYLKDRGIPHPNFYGYYSIEGIVPGEHVILPGTIAHIAYGCEDPSYRFENHATLRFSDALDRARLELERFDHS